MHTSNLGRSAIVLLFSHIGNPDDVIDLITAAVDGDDATDITTDENVLMLAARVAMETSDFDVPSMESLVYSIHAEL